MLIIFIYWIMKKSIDYYEYFLLIGENYKSGRVKLFFVLVIKEL